MLFGLVKCERPMTDVHMVLLIRGCNLEFLELVWTGDGDLEFLSFGGILKAIHCLVKVTQGKTETWEALTLRDLTKRKKIRIGRRVPPTEKVDYNIYNFKQEEIMSVCFTVDRMLLILLP
jgi:hypothetical protein